MRIKIQMKKKKKRRKKGGEVKKAMVALLVFILVTLEIVFGRKKCITEEVYLALVCLN